MGIERTDGDVRVRGTEGHQWCGRQGVVGFWSGVAGTGRYGVEKKEVNAGSSALRLASGLDMRLVELLL